MQLIQTLLVLAPALAPQIFVDATASDHPAYLFTVQEEARPADPKSIMQAILLPVLRYRQTAQFDTWIYSSPRGAAWGTDSFSKWPVAPIVTLAYAAAQYAKDNHHTPLEYLVRAKTGDSEYFLQADTGFGDVWMLSNRFSEAWPGQIPWHPGTGARELDGNTWTECCTFGPRITGELGYQDSFQLLPGPAVLQSIAAISRVPEYYSGGSRKDGVLGLAAAQIGWFQHEVQDFFMNIKGQLTAPMFAADLQRNAPGAWDFGYYNTDRYVGNITWTDSLKRVDNNHWNYWAIRPRAWSVGHHNRQEERLELPEVIIDSGVEFMYVHVDITTVYHRHVIDSHNIGDTAWTVPCNATLPDFNVDIEERWFTVPGDTMMGYPVGGGMCMTALQPNTAIKMAVFGKVFLQNFYVVFESMYDHTWLRNIGFAKRSISDFDLHDSVLGLS